MDEVSRAYYEIIFENRFLRLKGTAFQDMFADIMEKRHPGDFLRIRPGGPEGDHKSDGYLKSAKFVYQAYAPIQVASRVATKKIQDDFDGACGYWGDGMLGWIFVHNSRDGLLPQIVVVLTALGEEHPGLTITSWGFEELRGLAFELSDPDLAALFGPVPSLRDVTAVSAEDLKPVLTAIASDHDPAEIDVRPVPAGKLAKNQLSVSVQVLLRAGMVSADSVKRFFDHSADPGLGDRVAGRFKYEYGVLKGAGIPPDDIFLKLRDFAAGSDQLSPREEATVLAVLAYLFEQCDIFERPESEVTV